MFSVGLFSTYLPYVILAMFYGAYVGVHSIVKIEQQSAGEDTAHKGKVIFSDLAGADSVKDDPRNFHYDNFDTGTTPETIRSIQDPILIVLPYYIGPFPRSETFAQLYSRPPPQG